MALAKGIVVIVLIFILWVFLLSLYGFLTSVYPGKYISEETPGNYGWDYEEVGLTTADNFKIKGWYVPAANKTNSTIIVLHGYPFDKGNILSVTPFLHKDFNLFLIDLRGFGESQPTYTSFGHREKKDVQAAVDFAKKEKGQTNIGIYGFSMGGAVAIISAANNNDIKAVVSDSAYAEISEMARAKYGNLGVLNDILGFVTKIIGSVWFRTAPSSVSPISHISNVKAPILLIHGENDTQIPIEEAYKLKKANQKTELWVPKGLDHTDAHAELKDAYESRILEFFKANLKP